MSSLTKRKKCIFDIVNKVQKIVISIVLDINNVKHKVYCDNNKNI